MTKYATLLQVNYGYTREKAKREVMKQLKDYELDKRLPQMNNSIRATETNSLNLARLIAGMLIGLLVGFCMVILITPHSGEMTRNKIERQSILARKRAIDIYSELLLLSQFDKRKILSGTRKEYQSQ